MTGALGGYYHYDDEREEWVAAIYDSKTQTVHDVGCEQTEEAAKDWIERWFEANPDFDGSTPVNPVPDMYDRRRLQ